MSDESPDTNVKIEKLIEEVELIKQTLDSIRHDMQVFEQYIKPQEHQYVERPTNTRRNARGNKRHAAAKPEQHDELVLEGHHTGEHGQHTEEDDPEQHHQHHQSHGELINEHMVLTDEQKKSKPTSDIVNALTSVVRVLTAQGVELTQNRGKNDITAQCYMRERKSLNLHFDYEILCAN